jgi:hypothetical protein
LTVSCVTDERQLGTIDRGGNGGEKAPVELIYNEPLLLYDESFAAVKSMESRPFHSESQGVKITYMESKGPVDYSVSYYFENDRMTGASVVFDFDMSILISISKGLSEKYTLISEDPMLFRNEASSRQIAVDYSISKNYISIDY